MKKALLPLLFVLSFPLFGQLHALTGFSVEPAQSGLRLSWSIRQGFSTCFDVQVQQSLDGLHFETVFVYGGICGGETGDISYSWEYLNPIVNQVVYYRLAVADVPETAPMPYRVFDLGNEAVMVYPQPVAPSTLVVAADEMALPITLSLSDLQGRLVWQSEPAFARILALGEAERQGIHFLRVEDGKGRVIISRVVF
jgi:hypothetical protein